MDRKRIFIGGTTEKGMLTTFGIKSNEHSIGVIDRALRMESLFQEEEGW